MVFTVKIPKLQRYFFYLIWISLVVTGVYFAYFQSWQMQEPSTLTVNFLKIHGITAAIFLIIFGSLITVHIRLALQLKRNLITGFIIFTLISILVITGTALYYSPEEWHENIKWIHIFGGLIGIVLLPLHVITGIYQRKNRT